MILGMNMVHGAHYWSSARPWHEEALQIEPPWSGDWSAPRHVDTLVPGQLYRSRVSSNGEARGVKRFEVLRGQLAELNFCGSMRQIEPRGPNCWTIEIGHDNAWLEIRVAVPTKLADLRFSMVESRVLAGDQDLRIAPGPAWPYPWSQDFLSAAEPFPIWRVMDWTGAGSRAMTASLAEEFGTFAHRPLRENDTDPAFGTFDADTGLNPALWFPPGAREVWVCCPLMIALDPSERARWLVEAWLQSEATARRYGHPAPRLMVEVDNELENNDFTMARLAYHYARGAHWNQAVARTVGILRVAREMQRTIEQLGFAKRMTVVFATLPGNRWPFSFDQWMGQLVAPEARNLLQQLGHFATTFYWGADVLAPDQIDESINQEERQLRAWRSLMDELGVKTHIYETGPHFRREALPALHRAPETIEGAYRSISVIEQVLAPDARVYWYGFCERVQWGALTDLRPENRMDPLYQMLALEARARAYRA